MRNDTEHLLSSPRNAKRLLDAIRQLDDYGITYVPERTYGIAYKPEGGGS